MKKLITILAALFVSANSIIQAQDCLWAQSAGGTSSEQGNSICTDANGNVYVVGEFESPTITFGTVTLTNTDTSQFRSDVFIVKYNSVGNVIWAKSVGGVGRDIANSVSTDNNGNVYVAGRFGSPIITFDTTTLNNSNLMYADIFIAKYSADGNVLWAKSASGSNLDNATSIATDAIGNVFVTGYFESPTIAFDTINLINSYVALSDVFIVKYNSNGIVLWAKSFGGNSYDKAKSVCTDSNGDIYLTGNFGSPSIILGTTNLISVGSYDVFVVKYASDGSVLWAHSAGANYDECGESVATDAGGNLYVTGYFNSPTITFETTMLNNGDNSGNNGNIFLVKYSSDGSLLWAKSLGGPKGDYGNSICTDTSGNVFVSGYFKSNTITFGTTVLSNVDISGSFNDIFIAKYAPDGTALWANSAGGNNFDNCYGISTDSNGSAYITGGFYSPTITFGTTTLTNGSNSGNTGDMFIAKYSGVSTGTIEPLANNTLNISPNPTNSTITLTMPALKNSNVSITTLTGTEVGTYTTQNTSTQTIDISHLASGVYFVSLKSEEGVLTKKIIKQ